MAAKVENLSRLQKTRDLIYLKTQTGGTKTELAMASANAISTNLTPTGKNQQHISINKMKGIIEQ